MSVRTCVCVSGHDCVVVTQFDRRSVAQLSSAVEPQPRRLTAHVPPPTNLVSQLRYTVTEWET